MSESPFQKEVEAKLEALVDCLGQLETIVNDFQPESKQAVEKKVRNGMIQYLKELDAVKEKLDIYVPLKILQEIDQGRNPDVFTKDHVEKLEVKIKELEGKKHTFREFKELLEAELEKMYPEDMKAYREIKGQVSPS